MSDRSPSDTDVSLQEVVDEIEWPFPTWAAAAVFEMELTDNQAIVDMFNYLGPAIDRAFAADTVEDSITFKFWRKIKDTATKLKPVKLKATLYTNATYGNAWMHVEYGD